MQHPTRYFAIAAVLAAFTVPTLSAQQTAEQVFKNITALKGTPADQFVPGMNFISSSLGVQCDFCHVPGKPDADDKAAKKTAREMMAMTADINKNAFKGQRQVTCYSCHRGAARPVAIPPVLETDAPAPKPATPPAPAAAAPATGAPATGAPAGPTADQIAEKYLTAMGGADALKKINTRTMKGVIVTGGSESPIELFTKAPNKRISISKTAQGESITAFDGTAGWMGNTGRPSRAMSEADSDSAALDAEFSLAPRLKELFPQLRRGRPDEIAGAPVEVLTGTRQGKPPVRLFFDAKSGLLLRMVRYTETSMGRMPTQIDYTDYRDFDGVKVPCQWTLSRPNGRFTIKITEVKQNVTIDDSKFAKQ
jgi:photosynthetic reaction center cytochrome c subunit